MQVGGYLRNLLKSFLLYKKGKYSSEIMTTKNVNTGCAPFGQMSPHKRNPFSKKIKTQHFAAVFVLFIYHVHLAL